MPRLASYVHATAPNGEIVILAPGEDVPEWAVAAIRNPKAWEGGEAPEIADSKPESEEPPRSGRGSGEDVWREYANGLDIEVPEGASRDDIVALVDARNAE